MKSIPRCGREKNKNFGYRWYLVAQCNLGRENNLFLCWIWFALKTEVFVRHIKIFSDAEEYMSESEYVWIDVEIWPQNISHHCDKELSHVHASNNDLMNNLVPYSHNESRSVMFMVFPSQCIVSEKQRTVLIIHIMIQVIKKHLRHILISN